MSPKAVLIGLPGAGKSTTGRRLAKILGVPFADSDQLIEAREGRTFAALLQERDEAECRQLEADVIAAAVRDFEGVLSLGGGAVTRADTRAALAASGAPVVYLRASIDELTRRVGDGTGRPLLAGDPQARLTLLADARDPSLREAATMTVDTEGRTPGQVAATVAARLHELSRHA